ncbi:MAG: aldehyde dehydrogenase (NADP(+)) [Bacteroidetes bacterium]|nr:aldehyde dehydrogenase (NADP(+)) [Bacteroidota bacterium]MBS1973511.1 aldehyde dehydrogenase (NADP(+)) [Bacteroidota bacterium]
MFRDATIEEINAAAEEAWHAFHAYRKLSLKQRAVFIKNIAIEIEALGPALVKTAMKETNLPEARLQGEKTRTIFQLNSYAEACERGDWLEARIDTGAPGRTPPKPDIRKMLVPLGPVVVFGASNFPLAYSTAGGDTACAFAAGCPVIVKAHPAHAETSEMAAGAILKAVEKCNLPKGTFSHIHGRGFEAGKALATHKHVKAVGFTGSYAGGKALFDLANQRKEPIPVFSEMGSVNPVFLLPGKLNESAIDMAKMYSASVTLSVGQFCTNPGLIIGVEGNDLNVFTDRLGEEIKNIAPGIMLHQGIASAFTEKRDTALKQKGVTTVAVSATSASENQGSPTIAAVDAADFLDNPLLHHEVFGPYSLVIRCKDRKQMAEVARQMEGQLTATLMATVKDLHENIELVEAIKNICGRSILNGVPTGVDVCLSMHHGGPFPATTDSRFTSVGPDGIKRFARPVAFQNWPEELLPDELKNSNPLSIWRTVDNELTKNKI